MSIAVSDSERPIDANSTGARRPILLCCGCLAFAVAAAMAAARFPIQYTIAIVFLFAGPHNWIEARYFLTRLPPKLGKLRGFFLFAIGGALGLSALHAILPPLARTMGWDAVTWHFGMAIWCSLLIAWVATLVMMRSRQGPRRDWSIVPPIALAVGSLAWLQPGLLMLTLVFMHPLIGLWILDREIGQNRPNLRAGYRLCLASIPILVFWMAIRFAGATDLSPKSETGTWLVMQVGSNQLPFVSSHFLLSTHAFLETIHYGVWLIAIPFANRRVLAWRWDSMPLTRRAGRARSLVVAALGIGMLCVFVLWVAFSLDYSTTRFLYFQVAMIHVLTEIPFLLRLL